jgi:hypothetical protein
MKKQGDSDGRVKAAIREALIGVHSRNPLPTEKLLLFGARAEIEAALLDMYRAGEIACCKITRGGNESAVWWMAGAVAPSHGYGRAAVLEGKS